MVRVHFGPPLQKKLIRRTALTDRAVEQEKEMARKAALGNMPVACCNRRGFPAGKRVLLKPAALGFQLVIRERIWGFSSAGRAPALQAGGHRFDPGTLHQQEID